MYALVTIYKTILHYHRCFRYWSSLYHVNKNMDCWVEIDIKLDIFLDSICCLQHTWKEGYGINDCLCFVFIYFIIIISPHPHPKKISIGPVTTYSWKVLTLPKLFVKKYMPLLLDYCLGLSHHRQVTSTTWIKAPKCVYTIKNNKNSNEINALFLTSGLQP